DAGHGDDSGNNCEGGKSRGADEYAREDAGPGTKELIPDLDGALGGRPDVPTGRVGHERGAGDHAHAPSQTQPDEGDEYSGKTLTGRQCCGKSCSQSGQPGGDRGQSRSNPVNERSGDQRWQPHGTDVETDHHTDRTHTV